jgi:hypothetical protein
MNDGWDRSASSWIAALGKRGDWGREHVLDPIMLKRASAQRFERALDVGCGEGRFCRMLRAKGIPKTRFERRIPNRKSRKLALS